MAIIVLPLSSGPEKIYISSAGMSLLPRPDLPTLGSGQDGGAGPRLRSVTLYLHLRCHFPRILHINTG
jgi:hypothetical protein